MTADQAAALAIAAYRYALSAHVVHGDAYAARLLDDLRDRERDYVRAMRREIERPQQDRPIPYVPTEGQR